MDKHKVDIKSDISHAMDRGESLSQMEPMALNSHSKYYGPLADLALDLAAKSAGFRRSLPKHIVSSLADLVRSMNCYYSNLIEGHNTHPIDIERALKDDFSTNKAKRNLQLEARAHMEVQKWIDEGGLKEHRALSASGICEIHKRFYELLPKEFSFLEDPKTKEEIRISPGKLRQRDVQVGQHIAISPGAVPRFLQYFEKIYKGNGKTETIVAAAAAHHRLAWIHPFLDGNGRVIRLMSHATLLEVLDTGSLWSVARGLARSAADYKNHLANCDLSRRNDLDGRGSLSEEALVKFTEYFLKVCLDQVKFMENLMQPEKLRARISIWAEEEIRAGALPPKSLYILEALLYRGELARGELASIVSTGDRQARRILAALEKKNVIQSESSRAPIRLNFSATLASSWLPGLFPEQ